MQLVGIQMDKLNLLLCTLMVSKMVLLVRGITMGIDPAADRDMLLEMIVADVKAH